MAEPPPTVTQRASSAQDGESEPPRAADDIALVVRLHHEIVETPAPRQAFSPSQALHLASEGPAPRPGATIDDELIVLPDTPARAPR